MGDVVQEQFLGFFFPAPVHVEFCVLGGLVALFTWIISKRVLRVLSKAEMSLQDVKVVGEDWLKSCFIDSFPFVCFVLENAVYCIFFS